MEDIKEMAKVAVITRTKDRPLMLPRVRASIESQTFTDFVWVLVNDAGVKDPVDATADLARQRGVNVEVIHRTQSTGMEAASNDGVRQADSRYIVIHDDDDSWQPDFLKDMVDFLDKNDKYGGAICHSNKVVERIDGSQIQETWRGPYNYWIEAVHLADMLEFNTFSPISYLIRRSVYDELGGFDETLPVLGDWDFNMRALLNSDIGVVPKALANYHFREAGAPSDSYSNSLGAGIDKHVAFDAIYRHRKLREDIAKNQVGLGFLLQQGRQLMHTNSRLDVLVKIKAATTRTLEKLGLSAIARRISR
jgi:GT2 family glycosyltransferase